MESKENKKNTLKYIATGLIAVLAVLAVVFAFYLSSKKQTTEIDPSGNAPVKSESINTSILSTKKVSAPYVATDIPNVCYIANTSGLVDFYEFKNNAYEKIEPTGTVQTKIKLSGQEIPAKIYYLERGGVLTGFGVFTPVATDATVYIYDFAMFKITNLPKAYEQEGKCLLLVHTERSAVYYDSPIWEDSYVMDRKTGETTRFITENNRTTGINGDVKPDFCMITNTEIVSTSKDIPFFSSRFYENVEEGKKPIDLYIKNDKKETRTIENVLDKYAKPTEDGGFIYLRKKPDDSKFVEVVKRLNGADTVVHSLEGRYGTSIMRSGDWLLRKEDGKLYNTASDKVIETVGYKLNPLVFSVSPDSKYVIMMGTVTNALDYQIYVYNTETKNYKCFKDENYANHYGITFHSSTMASYYVVTPGGIESVTIDISKI